MSSASDVASWPGKRAKCVFAQDVPAIHVFPVAGCKDVDARHKAGHDDCWER
jgi:hypothetical protein